MHGKVEIEGMRKKLFQTCTTKKLGGGLIQQSLKKILELLDLPPIFFPQKSWLIPYKRRLFLPPQASHLSVIYL
jgi:hypothetical protein